MPAPRIVACIVTNDRRELLRECVTALQAQTRPVEEIVVIDNGSKDGAVEMLTEEFPDVELIAYPDNRGASAGFSRGVTLALEREFDWLWLIDDDGIARPDALAELLAALDGLDAPAAPALLCSRVEWLDGTAHAMNHPIMPRERERTLVFDLRDGVLPIRAATYVSLLLARSAMESTHPPLAKFFYQTDDIEYTARLLRDAPGYYVARSVVLHKTPRQHTAISDDRRFYYHLRNTLLMLRSRGWRMREKPRLVWWVVRTSYKFLRINHLHPRSIRTLLSALATGVRGKGGPRA
jgi:rhamnopyranosyl-N-acetylglucosaminyl-diphospho-decaprenol beta-1,3/1,4-galactofuranosyltransferase